MSDIRVKNLGMTCQLCNRKKAHHEAEDTFMCKKCFDLYAEGQIDIKAINWLRKPLSFFK